MTRTFLVIFYKPFGKVVNAFCSSQKSSIRVYPDLQPISNIISKRSCFIFNKDESSKFAQINLIETDKALKVHCLSGWLGKRTKIKCIT